MACPTRCLKYFLLVFIVLYAITGLALVILLGLNLSQLFDYHVLVPVTVYQCNWVVLGMGVAALLNAVLGWQATTRNSRPLLILFTTLLAVIILVQLSAAVWALVIRNTVEVPLPKLIEQAFAVHDNNNDSMQLWNSLQQKLQCCAVDGPGDYRVGSHIPWSCCGSNSPHEGSCQRLFQRGCVHPFTEMVKQRLAQTAAIAAIASLIQSGGALLATCYANTLTNERRRNNL